MITTPDGTPANPHFKLAAAKGIRLHTTKAYPIQKASAIIPVMGTKDAG
jgi:hypothetical protein